MKKNYMLRFFLLIMVVGITISSCHNRNPEIISESVFYKITGYQWSINPDIGPDGSVLSILRNPHQDFLQYYAFNSDSTVDYFCRNEYKTGRFYVDGDIVTCMFVEPEEREDIDLATDGVYNKKVVLKYKDDKLYKHDILYRTKDGEWISSLPEKYRVLYYENAGYYANNKYNAEYYSIGHDYDTTVDGMTVVERYNWREETYYCNGKRHGVYKRYENGRLSVFGTYTNGVPTGEWYSFFPSGQLTKVSTRGLDPGDDDFPKVPERKRRNDGAVAFFIQNPNIMTDEEKATPIPTGWIYFEEDVWQVNKEQMETLEVVARLMNDLPEDYICWVIGISDYYGSDAYNLKKSEKRAREVAQKLKEEFNVSPSRIFVDFKGKLATYGLF